MMFVASVALGLLSLASIFLTLQLLPLNGRASARYTMWFLALVAVALIIPAFLASSFWIPSAPIVSVNQAAHANNATSATMTPTLATPPTTKPLWRTGTLWLTVWLIGTMLLLARAALGLLRIRLLLRSARTIECRATSRGDIRVVAADLFDVPVAVGYRRPAVILPTAVLELESATDLENIILHELEHLRRYDDVTSLIQVLCTSLSWFNPFAYLIANRLSAEREMACDEAVVASTGKRARYAATLWKVASCSNGLAPNYVSAFRSHSSTVPRLDNLLSRRPITSALRMVCACLAAGTLQATVLGVAFASPSIVAASQPMSAFSQTRLLNGDTLVVGGESADGSTSHVAQLYDPQGHRVAVIPMHVGRYAPTVALLRNGDALVLGGVTDHGVTANAEIYQTSTRTFRLVAPMAEPRVGHTATLLLNGDLLVASGERDTGKPVAATEIYDPAHNRFTRTADGDDRLNQNAILVDRGSVLLYGGKHCTIIYDPATHGYRSGGRVIARTSNAIIARLSNGHLVRHLIVSASLH